jgi:small-conductance mechanosensitive channel
MEQILAGSHEWLWTAAGVAGAIVLALVLHRIGFSVAERITQRTGVALDNALVRRARRPARLILPLAALFLTLPALPLSPRIFGAAQHLTGLALIAGVAWLAVALIGVLDDLALERYRIDVEDNLRARQRRTQIQIVRRIAVVVVTVIATSIMLMTFPTIRRLGTSLLASAGIAGLVVGLAARPTLSSLIAGVQVALTEPIRIDDVVIVEGEWGWVEQIGITYVVVRIWDLRRLVVPLSYFIEHPFQNWTRKTADLLGTVFVYADYTVPVEDVRQELHRILGASGLWDGKVWNLQVTNATERTVELRALMSASDSSKAWDLRCHVREKLIAYLEQRHPQSLPRARAELETRPGSEGSRAGVRPPAAV